MDDFQTTSKELEDALEQELEYTEKQYEILKEKNASLKIDVERWKTKYEQALSENAASMIAIQQENEALREAHRLVKSRITDLELSNDAMERKERVVQSSYEDLEMKYNKVIEENAFLEAELAAQKSLEIEHQRLRDQLRDTTLELSLVKDKLEKVQAEKEEMASRTLLLCPTRRFVDTSQQAPVPTVDVELQSKETFDDPATVHPRIPVLKTHEGNMLPHSVKVMQEMSKRVKNLELHLQSCRILVKPLLSRSKKPNQSSSHVESLELNHNSNEDSQIPKLSHHLSESSPLQNKLKTPLKKASIRTFESASRSLSSTCPTREFKTSIDVANRESMYMSEVSPSRMSSQKTSVDSKNEIVNSIRRMSIKAIPFNMKPSKSPKRQIMPSAIPVPTETSKRRVSGISQSAIPNKTQQSLLKTKNSKVFETNI